MRCVKCGARMVQIDCYTFACPKCLQLSIDKRKALKRRRELNAELDALAKRTEEVEE